MYNVPDESDPENTYECMECGEIVVSETHPVECPECGASMRDRAMSLE